MRFSPILRAFEAPAYMYSKALTHQQKVCRLYKRALNEVRNYQMPDILKTRFEQVLLRARFDAHKNEKDMIKAKQLMLEGYKELFFKKHPQPIRWPKDPGGPAFRRQERGFFVDSCLDYWSPREKALYPQYFANRALMHKDIMRQWDKIMDEKEDEVRARRGPTGA